MSKTRSFWAAAAMAALVTVPAAAQQPDTARIRQLIAQAVQQSEQQPIPPQAGGLLPPGPRVNLSVDEAVTRALERNLDIQVQRLEPQLLDLQTAALYSFYRPTVTSSFFTQGATTLPTSQLQALGGSRITDDMLQWNGGLQKNMQWGGGSATLNFNNTRLETSNTAATRNPAYTSNLLASYTQPLLRNFKTDSTRSSLLINRLQEQITDLNLRSTLTVTEASVRNAYWDLVFAIENVEAARRSLELATKLVQDNRARVEIGTMAPIDVVQAQAEEATRRQALVAAEATRRTSELALKRLIVNGTEDELWGATLEPTDRPSPVAEALDLEGAVRAALANRTDLAVARRSLEQNEIAMRSLRNQTLPDLNLQANYRLQGRGGTEFIRQGIGGAVSNQIPGGYFDALSNIRNFDAPTWSFQLNFNYPLGQSQAEASYARARVQVSQTQAQLKQAELIIATEVTNAALNVGNSFETVQAAAVSRELAERRLEAAQSKFDVGMATNFEVVQAQRDLADARTVELRNILNYRKALVEFERSQLAGTSRSVTSIR